MINQERQKTPENQPLLTYFGHHKAASTSDESHYHKEY